MNYGKKVCATLRQVRKQIADANGIPYEVTECKHQGDCRGTCPKCEAELRYIENQLSLRRAAGVAVTVVGLSLGVATGFSSCTSCHDEGNPPEMLASDVAAPIDVNEESEGEIIEPEDTPDPELQQIPLSYELEEPAEFPGGESELKSFVKQNLRYPDSCIEAQVQGRVILMLIIEKDGKISDVQMKRSVCDEMTNEAIRIVRKMPKWKPAKINGEAVRCKEFLPITFRLE